MSELESVLGNDMPGIASYLVSQKGIFKTDDLIAHAENHLVPEIRNGLPATAVAELREAGKCLAYEVPTASAFHLWRAVEIVAGAYYTMLTKRTFEDDKIQRNWYSYIQALEKEGADKKIHHIP